MSPFLEKNRRKLAPATAATSAMPHSASVPRILRPSRSWLVLPLLAALALVACGDDADTTPDAAMVGPDADPAERDGGGPDGRPFGDCRSGNDCEAVGELCIGPSDPGCGVPPREGCSAGTECGDGAACHAISDTCSLDGIGSMCGPPCDATSCDVGFECHESGRCVAIVCGAAGFSCRRSETCDPESIDADAPVHARGHGCVSIPCSNDSTCPDTTYCVNGRCQDSLGTCSPPRP